MEFDGDEIWYPIDSTPYAQGGNSYVYRAVNHSNNEVSALKLYIHRANERRQYDRFLQEIEIVKSISNLRGCVRLLDHGFYEEQPFYVMPFYKGGTFKSKYLNANDTSCYSEKLEKFQELLQIIRRLHYIGLAVRDIKPQNILFDASENPIVADFGLSFWVEAAEEERMTRAEEKLGAQGYRPPEWDSYYPGLNHCPGDIWSLGRTLWAMFARKNPPNNYETLGYSGTHLKLHVEHDIANLIQSIVVACTSQYPEKRPTARELISHVEYVRNEVEPFEAHERTVKQRLEDHIPRFVTQLKSSEVYLSTNREETETNVRLHEVDECLESLRAKLDDFAFSLNGELEEGIGSIRTLRSERELLFPLKDHGLIIQYSDNISWNKSIAIRFDPSTHISQHRHIKYAYLKFHLGLTVEKNYYWIVSSRDQTSISEYIVEQITPTALRSLTRQKLEQLDELVYQHFIKRIEANFKG